ncbi:MAG: GyrI-like domain-containing protein [Spirochaetota bacterium]
MASLSEPRFVHMPARLLVGRQVRMSLAQNRSAELWQSFRPLVAQIPGRVGTGLFSVQVYDGPEYFSAFEPQREFHRWACVEVAAGSALPAGLEALTLPEGQYAVFDYRGTPAEFATMAAQIYTRILPQAGYSLDDRPHFEVLSPGYQPDDPAAEETIWIPVR